MWIIENKSKQKGQLYREDGYSSIVCVCVCVLM